MNEQCDFHPDGKNRCPNTATWQVWMDADIPEEGYYLRVCKYCLPVAQVWWKKHGWVWEA